MKHKAIIYATHPEALFAYRQDRKFNNIYNNTGMRLQHPEETVWYLSLDTLDHLRGHSFDEILLECEPSNYTINSILNPALFSTNGRMLPQSEMHKYARWMQKHKI